VSLLFFYEGTPPPNPGGFATPNTPNLADFQVFLSTSVQIPPSALPANSPWPGYALNQAIGIVWNPPCATFPGILYTLAVYNLATHLIFLITPDQVGQSYFANARGNNSSTIPPGFALNAPQTGLVVTSSDQGTSVGLTAPTWAAGMTVADLGYYQTPWGRAYLAFAQSYGPTIVGLS
jgi:hypothetical protein